jgi:hypothetical protein
VLDHALVGSDATTAYLSNAEIERAVRRAERRRIRDGDAA